MRIATWSAGALLTGAAVALTGCTKTVDTKDVEKKISKALTAQYGQNIKTTCPGSLTAKKGKTYICTVVAPDGSKAKIKLTMVDDSGKFSFMPVTGAKSAGGGTQ